MQKDAKHRLDLGNLMDSQWILKTKVIFPNDYLYLLPIGLW